MVVSVDVGWCGLVLVGECWCGVVWLGAGVGAEAGERGRGCGRGEEWWVGVGWCGLVSGGVG